MRATGCAVLHQRGHAGRLSDEEIWAVLAYIKSRWPKEILAARVEMLRQR